MPIHNVVLTDEQESIVTNETGKTVEEYVNEMLNHLVTVVKRRDIEMKFEKLSQDDKVKAIDLLENSNKGV